MGSSNAKFLGTVFFFCSILLCTGSNAQLLDNPFTNRYKANLSLKARAKVKREIQLAESNFIDANGKANVKLDTSEISFYDESGNLIKTKRFYNGGYRRIIYTYNSENRKIKEAVYDNESTFSMGGATTWEYNVGGNKVMQTNRSYGATYQNVVSDKTPNESHYMENGVLKRTTKETFDASKLIHTSDQRDEAGKLIGRQVYKVDNKNRMVEEKSINDDLSVASTTTYKFDAAGNEIEMLYDQGNGSGYKDVVKYNDKSLKVEIRRTGLDDRPWSTTRFVYEYY